MRAMVDAKEFSQALDKVSKTAKRSSIPVLEGVLVEIVNGRCTLTATDLTTWLTAEFPARGDDLSFVLQRTKDTVRACRHFEGELALELSETGEGKRRRLWLTLSCGPREAKIAVIIPEEFPSIGTDEYGRTFTANADRLLERTQRVKYTLRTSDPNEKPVRCQVQFRGADVYALDGHRLACDTDPELPVPIPFMAPPDALEHLKSFGEQEVSLSFGQRYLRITDGFFTIYTRFNLADIFDLNSAVPKQFMEEFQVSTQEFLRELAYLKEFAPSSGKAHVCFSGGRLSMTAHGETYATQIQINGCSNIVFGFDLRYMVEALRQLKTEAWVSVKVNSPFAPIVITAEGRGDFAMILPVRVSAAATAA